MPEKKKIKVKRKKRKLKVKRIIICILILILLSLIALYIKDLPIKNIYIIGNNILTDKEVIELSKISNYPPFLTTSSTTIKKKLLKNDYIKDVKVEKKLISKIYIYITEKKPIGIYNNKVLLEDSTLVDNNHNINTLPIITNDISTIIDKFTNKFSKVDNDILLKISEISYTPNDVDTERFLLKMNDGNQVYITLSKITKINKYNDIYSSMDNKKGIIYLDSGDYIEVKEAN